MAGWDREGCWGKGKRRRLEGERVRGGKRDTRGRGEITEGEEGWEIIEGKEERDDRGSVRDNRGKGKEG